jgi:formylglycine-generating enzyme required for sulfatase activity/predicted Ser/Thr protein kinase
MPEDLRFGAMLSHYVVVGRLGAGGMGVVYRARDSKLERDVALKVLPPDFASDPDRQRRFEREAKAASSLSHPGVAHIYELGEADGAHFIVMELVEGRTLQQLLADGPLPPDLILDVAAQVAEALREAHARGVVHRDIKPGNIMLTPRGQAKVLDFGLARVDPAAGGGGGAASLTGTDVGVVVGTVPYMSPEQILGRVVDHRSDLFSFGAVLYEMVTGRRPFGGGSAPETLDQILHSQPALTAGRPRAGSRGLDRVIARCLEKDPNDRYPTASELVADLTRLREERSGPRPRPRLFLLPLLAAALLTVALAILFARRVQRREEAARSVARVAELTKAGRHYDAFVLAERIRDDLADKESLDRLGPEITDELTVTSEPAGARVTLRRFPGKDTEPVPGEVLGTTPLSARRIPRADYLLLLDKEGYAPLERTISSALARAEGEPPGIRVEARLVERGRVPKGVSLVPGGDYGLVGWGRLTFTRVPLDEYLIDRFEVSNRDYKEFVDAGGYLRKELWAHAFVKDGRRLSFEEAVRELRDRVGLPGPRSWSSQSFPEGKADHPVTDLSWYEAAAYCAFRGKSLPTLFQWEKAARDGAHATSAAQVMPFGHLAFGEVDQGRTNFSGTGTLPVRSLEFGMSPYGCYHMAGNVAEWCRNEASPGFVTAGGSFGDLPYRFGEYGGFPAFYSAPTLGFRCAQAVPNEAPEEGGRRLETAKEVPVHRRTGETELRAWESHYRLDHGPLEASVLEVEETAAWRREKVVFRGAKDEKVLAYLYLPQRFPRPLQVVHYVPSYAAFVGLSVKDEVEQLLKPLLLGGRAVFAVVLEGYVERAWPADYKWPAWSSVKARDRMVAWVTDLRRGADYLETRPELDLKRLAFLGTSFGTGQGLILTAVDDRYRSVVLLSSGADRVWVGSAPEANPVHFAPHIRVPKLMLNGRYDEEFSLPAEIDPLFALLREPKRRQLFDSGHLPPQELVLPAVNAFLDETVGPVRRE